MTAPITAGRIDEKLKLTCDPDDGLGVSVGAVVPVGAEETIGVVVPVGAEETIGVDP